MSSLKNVARRLAAAHDKMSECRDAPALLATALEGSADPERDTALANLTEVDTNIRRVWNALAIGMALTRNIADRLTDEVAVSSSTETPDAPALPNKRIEALRAELTSRHAESLCALLTSK